MTKNDLNFMKIYSRLAALEDSLSVIDERFIALGTRLDALERRLTYLDRLVKEETPAIASNGWRQVL